MGNDSVFMSEDRFSQFMHSVEAVAEASVDETVDEEIATTDILEEEPISILETEENIEANATENAEELQEVDSEYAQETQKSSQSVSESALGIGDLITKALCLQKHKFQVNYYF